MKALESVLKEERARLKAVAKGYWNEISKLPKGSIQGKKIKEKSYPYRVLSEKGNVRYEYLGKLSGVELKELKEKINLRKKYKILLKEVRANQKIVERALHGKK